MHKVLHIKMPLPSTNWEPQVAVSFPMARYYRSFMEAVQPASNSDTDRFLACVQVVVWGSLYAEAQVNLVGQKLLDRQESHLNKGVRALWKLAERAEIEKKVEALGQMFESDKDLVALHLKELGRLVRMRNRLVHYKEMPTAADASWLSANSPEGKNLLEALHEATERLANPDIVHAVLSISLEDRRLEVVSLCEWLASLKVL